MRRLLLALLILAVTTTLLHTSEGSPLLGSLLGGKKGGGGLLGGLLGGEGGLLGGEGGLLGGLLSGLGLDKILEQIWCLLEQLGLDVVLQLLRGLSVDSLLGLNDIACQEGGGELLGVLFSEDGLLGKNGVLDVGSLVAEVLCLVEDVGLETVVELVDQLDVDELLHISHYICASGEPLFGKGVGGGILGILSGKSGLLSGLLGSGLDLETLVGDLLCFVEWNGLEAVNDLVDQLEVDVLLGVSGYICRDGKPLFSAGDLQDGIGILSIGGLLNGILSRGLDLQTVVGDLLCVVKWNGLETVTDLVDQIGVDDILQISDYICKDGNYLFKGDEGREILDMLKKKDGPLGDLQKSGTDIRTIIGDVTCFKESIGQQKALDLVKQLQAAGFLKVSNCICENGNPQFSPDEGKVIIDWLSGTGPLGGLDIKLLSGDLLCLLEIGGIEAIVDLLDSVGIDRLLEVSGYICRSGEFGFTAQEKDALFSIILTGRGLLDRLLDGGTDIHIILGKVLCFCQATGLGLEQVIELIQKMGVDNFLSLTEYICRSGRPIYSAADGQVMCDIFDAGLLRGISIDILVEDLLCVLKWSGGYQAVVHFVNKLGVDTFFKICSHVCRGGRFLLTEDEGESFLWILLSNENILRRIRKGDLDIEILLNDALCLNNGIGLPAAIELLKKIGVDGLLSFSGYFCESSKPTFTADEGRVLIDILKRGSIGLDIKTLVGNLLCLSKWLGLETLVDLVDRLGVDSLLGICGYVCRDGKFLFTADEGDILLTIFQSDNGMDFGLLNGRIDLRLVLGDLICIAKRTDLETALTLLDQLGADDFLRLSRHVCKSGVPIFSEDEGRLLIDISLEGGLFGGLNIKDLLGDLFCFMKWSGLQAVVDLVDEYGVDSLLDISAHVCKGGRSLFSDEDGIILVDILLYGQGVLEAFLLTGFDLDAAIRYLLCIVRGIGLESVVDIYNDLGINALLYLVDTVCGDGGRLITVKGNSLLQLILSLDGTLQMDILDKILCLLKSFKLDGVLKLVGDLGLEQVLGLYGRLCPGGRPVMKSECEDTDFFDSLDNVHDRAGIIEDLQCLIQQLDLDLVGDLLESLGMGEVLKLQSTVCPNGLPLIEFASLEPNQKTVITKIAKAVRAARLDWLIKEFGMETVVKTGVVVEINGVILANNLNKLVCIFEALGADNVLDLVESSSLNNVMAISETVCPGGQAIKPGPSVNTEILVQLLVMCERGDSVCRRALDAAFNNKSYFCSWDVCPCCKFLQSKKMRDECKTTCDTKCVE